jgi:3-oxoacyl-[acyl-carrier protein] reductase
MGWGADPTTRGYLEACADEVGARTMFVEADLADPDTIPALFERVTSELGEVSALVMSHCESVNSTIESTPLESFERHFAVNARASWLLIREFARRFVGPHGAGRIVALTSDHTVGNLAYGASKGAMDRIVLAAATELARRGVTANVINPGPTDTGWMSDALKRQVENDTPLGRNGTPRDAANLVSFLCSEEGGWINGQLLVSDGGFSAT